MKDILILIDDRGMFYSTSREKVGSMNVSKLKLEFEKFDYSVEVKKFYEIDFNNSYKGKIVLYQSTEDPDLRYKGYIEDILLGLKESGAILIPNFNQFRAHHNKVFMEVLRRTYGLCKKTNIYSTQYGTLEEFIENIKNHIFPIVIKPSFGSRSKHVYKVDNIRQAIKKIKIISKSFTFVNIKRAILGFMRGGYKPISNFRNKFIVQNFVSDLKGDYRVLIYGDKYYVLYRENRDNDFTASGSGKLSFPKEVSSEMLDYLEELFKIFKTPFASLDIAFKDGKFYLLEFQFVGLGQYALEKSDFYFIKENYIWKRIDIKSELEKVFVYSVNKYINLYLS